MSNNNEKTDSRLSVIEVFMEGARVGFGVAIRQILPAMILGFTIVLVFEVTGLADLLGKLCGPAMGVFGLPGEAVTVLVAAFFAKAAGASAAAELYATGVLSAAQVTILLLPCMLMGTLVGHYARVVLVSDTRRRDRKFMWLIPFVDSIIGMFFMRLLLTVMGYM